MIRRADLQPDSGGQRSRQPQTRAENADYERVAGPNDFQPTADANTERFEPMHIVAIGFDAAYDGALLGGQGVQPGLRLRR